MAHSKIRLWVHVVFATKYREAQILPTIEPAIYHILFQHLTALGCWVDILNGMPDHVHGLFLLNQKIALADLMGKWKGVSSHEINSQQLLPVKFAWQTGYSAFSVSESKVSSVRNYIANQKNHHRFQDYAAEIAWLEKLHGLNSDEELFPFSHA